MRSIPIQLCVLYCCWTCSASAEEARTLFRNGQDYNAYRIPAVVRCANGDLLAFCEAREGGDASRIDLVLRRSTDQGASWLPMEVVQSSQQFSGYFEGAAPPITIGNPAPVVDLLDPIHPGRVWLPFTLENDRVFVTHSDDDGKSWEARREITEEVKLDAWGWYATGPVHSIQLQRSRAQRGRLVVPCDHRIGRDGADRGPCGVHVIYSDDHGQSWKLGAIDDTYEDGLNGNETTVVELNDGRLYFNTRDQNGEVPGTRGAAYSSDGGLTFDAAAKSSFASFVPLEAPFDPPVVQCSLLRVQCTTDGDPSDLILFCGPDESGPTGKGRSDLRIRLTTDETQSWQDGALLHVGPAAYSDMIMLDDGYVGIIFEAGTLEDGRYNRIDFRRVSIGELVEE